MGKKIWHNENDYHEGGLRRNKGPIIVSRPFPLAILVVTIIVLP